ncbi:MAG: hypothetical protein D6788_04465, partial [Planctomycetota bacterium]
MGLLVLYVAISFSLASLTSNRSGPVTGHETIIESLQGGIMLVVVFLWELVRPAERDHNIALSIFLFIEGFFVAVGFLLAPWTARGEPLVDSFSRATRTALVSSGLLAWVLFLATMFRLAILMLWFDWPASVRRTTGMTYDKEMTIVRWCAYITVPIVYFACLLRAAAGGKKEAPPRGVPLCGRCGYNLTGLPLDTDCPECGRSVADSVGPNAPPGAPWEQRRRLGRWVAWLQTARDAVRDPADFGSRLRITPQGADHVGFLWLHMPIVFLAGWAAAIPGSFPELSLFSSAFPHHPLFEGLFQVLMMTVVVLFAAVACGGRVSAA